MADFWVTLYKLTTCYKNGHPVETHYFSQQDVAIKKIPDIYLHFPLISSTTLQFLSCCHEIGLNRMDGSQ